MVTGAISKYYTETDFDETIRCPILTIMPFIFVLYEVGEICRKYLHRSIIIFFFYNDIKLKRHRKIWRF